MKTIKLIILLLLPTLGVNAQSGTVQELLSYRSEILESECHYSIYLPPDYESSNRSYPVLYFLAGGEGSSTSFIQHLEIDFIANHSINMRTSLPMIIVMPDAANRESGFMNDIRGGWNYEEHFFKEFIPFIENKYRIRKSSPYRSIAGYSAGAEAAFLYAIHQPDSFYTSSLLAMGVSPNTTYEDTKKWLREIEGGEKLTESAMKKFYETHDAFHLLKTKTKEELERTRWYIDCGDDDFLSKSSALIHMTLSEKEVAHEYRVRDGGHLWEYFRESIPEVLKFISKEIDEY